MKINYLNTEYITEPFDDLNAGCAGLILLATTQGEVSQVGKITFWDSLGQFLIELSAIEIPLDIIENFIIEAKKAVPIE